MVEELIKKLLEAGVHFGHQTKRWNPKMKRFIFGERSGIYIIDLEKTAEYLNYARDYVRDVAAKGGKILFVGTKKQAQSIVAEEAKKADMYYVNHRWLGGLLTNFQTVKKSIARLKSIEKMQEDGTVDNLKKKEVGRLMKEKDKLLRDLAGIRDMSVLPQAIFIVDVKREDIAIREATKLGIPIIGVVDTNSNPDSLDYPIPGNDDALKSIGFLCSMIAESVKEGKEEFVTGGTVKKKESAEEGEKVSDKEESDKEESPAQAASEQPVATDEKKVETANE